MHGDCQQTIESNLLHNSLAVRDGTILVAGLDISCNLAYPTTRMNEETRVALEEAGAEAEAALARPGCHNGGVRCQRKQYWLTAAAWIRRWP